MVNVRDNIRNNNNAQPVKRITKPILIIEDQDSLLVMLKQLMLASYDVQIHTASNYAQAKSCLSKHRHEYLLAICDLNLPDAPKGEIVDLINRAKVRMITMTGSFGEKLRSTMIEKGVIDYIIKDSINAYEYAVELVGRIDNNAKNKLLLVDDSATSRAIIEQMLRLQNFDVLTAENGQQALTLFEQNPDIKLVLTDYQMPEMDGFNLTLALRQLQPKEQLAIIGLSSTGNSELGAQFIKNGANDFLTKPVAYEELLCRINQNISLLDYMEALRTAANCDFLTGLFNRRYFFSTGEDIFQAQRSSTGQIAVAMFDIDHFKQINDTYGHEAGDELLVFFAQLIKEVFCQSLVARIGGEEFCVLFYGVQFANALSLCQQFREQLAQTKITFLPQELSITVSIGLHQQLEDNLDAMLKKADVKLYQAKAAGRNQVIN